MRTFLASLLRTVRFGATPTGQPVLAAPEYLRNVEEKGRVQAGDPPWQVITGSGAATCAKRSVEARYKSRILRPVENLRARWRLSCRQVISNRLPIMGNFSLR